MKPINGKPVVAKISSQMLALASAFAAQNDVRYYLNGVHVRPSPDGGTYVEACNGHIAIVVRDLNGFAASSTVVGIHKGDVAAAKRGHCFAVTDDRMGYVLDISGAPVWASPSPRIIETTKYPDIAALIPPVEDLVEGFFGTYNTNFIALVCDAARGTKRDRYPRLQFFRRHGDAAQSGEKLLAVIDGTHIALVMPMLSEGESRIARIIPSYRALPRPAAKPAEQPIAPSSIAEAAP